MVWYQKVPGGTSTRVVVVRYQVPAGTGTSSVTVFFDPELQSGKETFWVLDLQLNDSDAWVEISKNNLSSEKRLFYVCLLLGIVVTPMICMYCIVLNDH